MCYISPLYLYNFLTKGEYSTADKSLWFFSANIFAERLFVYLPYSSKILKGYAFESTTKTEFSRSSNSVGFGLKTLFFFVVIWYTYIVSDGDKNGLSY